MSHEHTTFIWVVGCPRSGTTFLTDLIGKNCDLVYNEPGTEPNLQRGMVDRWAFPEASSICFKWCENYRVADKIMARFPNSYFLHIMRERNNNVFSMAFPKETAFPPRQFPGLGDEADERIKNAMQRWVTFNQGCLDLEKKLGERYLPIFYEQLPSFYADITRLTGITLQETLPFRNQNLPKEQVNGLEAYWAQIDGAEAVITRIGRMRQRLQTGHANQTPHNNDPAGTPSPEIKAPAASTQIPEAPGSYRDLGDHHPSASTAQHFPPKAVTYPSPYGGLWIDSSAAPEIISGKQELGWITADEAEKLRFLHQNGFVILEGAVSQAEIDRLNEEFSMAWNGETSQCKVSYMEDGGKHLVHASPDLAEKKEAKLLDFHMVSDAGRQAIFNDTLSRYLALIFERPPVAFQSLGFAYGSQQSIHSDIAFVRVDSPREFCASWIALEDIQEGSGELVYYPGSQQLPDFVLDNGSIWSNSMMRNYGNTISAAAEQAGLTQQRFLPKKGDVLIWTAGIYHGGAPITDPEQTRRSLVTHYYPLGRKPLYQIIRGGEIFKSHGNGYVCGKTITEPHSLDESTDAGQAS